MNLTLKSPSDRRTDSRIENPRTNRIEGPAYALVILLMVIVLVMNMFSKLVMVSLLINLSACGTVLYPERKGQAAGDIDVKVAVLNGIGVLFFLIPGVIAYAVDFNNGTIYLPANQHSAAVDAASFAELNLAEMSHLTVQPETLKMAELQRVVAAQTGTEFAPDAEVEVYQADANGSPGATL